jgi:hypothetical protein
MLPGSIDVLALQDPCFAWTQLELAGLELFWDALKHILHLGRVMQ